MKRYFPGLFLLGIWLAFVLIACNLSSPPPPTIVPRATATPPPTIGYATLSPNELPSQATTVPATDTALTALLGQVQPDRLMATVNTLAGMWTRHINSFSLPGQGIGQARDYIRDQFIEIRNTYPDSGFANIDDNFAVSWADVNSTATNIIGLLPGSEVGGGVIVIGGHYDSISFNPTDGTMPAPGADDNASSIAALIEMARIMAARGRPRATVLFVAFSAEEIGRKGSIAFIDDYLRPNNIQISAMINMDIIGSQTGADGSINDRQIRAFSEGPDNSPSRQLARAISLIDHIHNPTMEVVVQDAVDRKGRYSDHMSFSEAGMPSMRFVEALEEPNRQHTDRDTPDDVQANYLTRSTQTILAALVALADGPRAPANVVVRDNGNGTRTLVWEPVADARSYIVALRYPGSLVYNQYFETTDTTIVSQIFTSSRLASVAIAARGADGLIGPLSIEYYIAN